MSDELREKLSDIIELIRTTNEVYFITAPERVRAVFILVDDLVELSLKTYLYCYTKCQREQCKSDFQANGWAQNDGHLNALDSYFKERIEFNILAQRLGMNGSTSINNLQSTLNTYGDLRHWSVNHPDAFKNFGDVVNEVKVLYPNNTKLNELLDRGFIRHDVRNKLYHDHHSTGWSIRDERCLEAMCDLFDLLTELFPDFLSEVKRKPTVSCQIGVLRLKFASHQSSVEVVRPYLEALNYIKKNHNFEQGQGTIEHSLVHTSDSFFYALLEQFKNTIARKEMKIAKLERIKRKNDGHRIELANSQRLLVVLKEHFNQINALF